MNKIDRDTDYHCWDMVHKGDNRDTKSIEMDASWKALHDQIPKEPKQKGKIIFRGKDGKLKEYSPSEAWVKGNNFENANESKNMNNKLIRLTENELKRIVKESVSKVLIREGIFDFFTKGRKRKEVDKAREDFLRRERERREKAERRFNDERQRFEQNGANAPVTVENLHNYIQINITSQGMVNVFPINWWNRKAVDIRNGTKPGWGTNNGLYYYYKPIDGRGGDNITIWLRERPTQKLANELVYFINSVSRFDNAAMQKLANMFNNK